MPRHRDVYNAMRGTLTKSDGTASMPHWDDLPEFVRSALLAVRIEAEQIEREACAKIADGELMEVYAAGEDRIAKSIAAKIRSRI